MQNRQAFRSPVFIGRLCLGNHSCRSAFFAQLKRFVSPKIIAGVGRPSQPRRPVSACWRRILSGRTDTGNAAGFTDSRASYNKTGCGGSQHPFLRLVESVVPRLVAETFAVRRQRSHVRIVSAHQFLVFHDDVPSAQLDRSCDILIRAGLSRPRFPCSRRQLAGL
jgi:hypothetical protein